MRRFISFLETPKGIVLLGFLVVALIAIPLTVYLVGQQQTLQQSAHVPNPSVSAACQPTGVAITYNYTLTNLPSGVTATVSVSDSQGYVTDSFLYKNGDAPYSKTVRTNQQSILHGILTFQTNATDGFNKTDQVGYNQTGPCATPTVTVTLTPTVTVSPIATPSVTATVTLTPTLTISPSPTPIAQISNTNTPTPGPGSSNTPTSAPTTVIASADQTLPPAGPGDNLVTFGFLGAVIAIIGGIILFAL